MVVRLGGCWFVWLVVLAQRLMMSVLCDVVKKFKVMLAAVCRPTVIHCFRTYSNTKKSCDCICTAKHSEMANCCHSVS